MNAVTKCVEALLEPTHSLGDARREAEDGGIPSSHGFYAWWVKRGALAGMPRAPHPTESHLDLAYVGIGPVRATSAETLRSRVVKFHMRGNTGSSTLRLSFAGLLMDALDLKPLKKVKKVVLPNEDNSRLSEWQDESLRITWCECPEPWKVEAAVITRMKPPLNLEGNSAHPYYATNRASRARFKASARVVA